MQKILVLFVIFLLLICSDVCSQSLATLHINKIKGKYYKELPLPINIKLIMQDNQVIVIRLDSVSKDFLYYNHSKDSIAFKDVYSLHVRGLKSFVKYTGLAALGIGTICSAWFTIYAFNYPVVLDGENAHYKYVGIAYTSFFAGLWGLLYSLPRTRFVVHKYSFEMKH